MSEIVASLNIQELSLLITSAQREADNLGRQAHDHLENPGKYCVIALRSIVRGRQGKSC
jgi:hypothetical protein